MTNYKSLGFMGFPNYRVGDDGSVWSCNSREGKTRRTWGKGEWIQLKLTVDCDGYLRTTLFRDAKRFIFGVHRLVLEAFVGPRPDGMECCHNDGNRQNNRLENLRWDTVKGNARDRELHGHTAKGERNGFAKLNADEVRSIRELYKTGNYTQQELGEMFSTDRTNITLIVLRRGWKHV